MLAALALHVSIARANSPAADATNADAPPPAARAYLIHLPGVAGETSLDRAMLRGLLEGGVDAEACLRDWTCGEPGIKALWARARNDEQAQLIADEITRQFRAHPARPIHLTSHSGGTGIAVWALERLPEDVMVQSVLLLAPALSPEYDLSAALRHVRGSVYAFFSPHDVAVLGTGTKLFGTIDGIKSEAAGLVGFTRPATADESLYEKLVPMAYDDDWMRIGNIGDHIGPMTRRFAREFLAGIILTGQVPVPTTQPASPSPSAGVASDKERLISSGRADRRAP